MSDQHTLIIGGPVVTLGKPEEWEAPDGFVAQRWADEVNARGGSAEVSITSWGDGSHQQWKVRVFRSIPHHLITPSP